MLRKFTLLLAPTLVLACSSQDAVVAPPTRLAAPSARRYIVVLRDTVRDISATSSRLLAQGRSVTRRASFNLTGGNVPPSDERVYSSALHGFAQTLSDDAVAEMKADPRVAYVEPDVTVHATTVNTETGAGWNLDRIDQRSLPLNSAYSYGVTGAGVNVYILDTGIRYTHAEFGGRAHLGIDEVTLGGDGVDCNEHGTHVAGTVGGALAGVAKDVTLYSVRVLDCNGGGDMSGVIAGLDWVASQKATQPTTPMVVNMSLGSTALQAMDDAVRRATQAGVVVVVAAGNESGDACNHSPARAPEAITVGATDWTDAVASFSNTGRCVDLFAPGVSIRSSYFGADTLYATASGTSMASPAVAGAAALYLERNPTATPATVAQALVSNATAGSLTGLRSTLAPNKLLYTGFLNAPLPATPTTPTATFTTSCTKLTCTLDASKSTSGAKITTYMWNIGGAAATGARVTKTFTSTIDVAVTLIVKDAANLADTTRDTITFTDKSPTAAGSVTCKRAVCTFSSAASKDDWAVTSVVWQFGDAATATAKTVGSVSHTYASLGSYSAKVIVGDAAGHADTATVPVTAADNAPVAKAIVSCVTRVCSFTNKSTDDGTNTKYFWDFGDNTTSTAFSPSHTYPLAAGTYTVKLTVTDDANQSSSTTLTVNSGDSAPTAAFTVTCTKLVCKFDGRSSTDDGGIKSWAWLFGSTNKTATGSLPSFTFPAAGSYAVKLTVTDGAGQTAMVTKTVTVTAQ